MHHRRALFRFARAGRRHAATPHITQTTTRTADDTVIDFRIHKRIMAFGAFLGGTTIAAYRLDECTANPDGIMIYNNLGTEIILSSFMFSLYAVVTVILPLWSFVGLGLLYMDGSGASSDIIKKLHDMRHHRHDEKK